MKKTVTKGPKTCCNYAYKLCFVQFVYMHMTLCKIHSSVSPFMFLDYQSKGLPVLWVSLWGMRYTKTDLFFFFFFIIVVLHNSAHYASDATLNERNEIPSCALLQNWTQLCMPLVSKSSFLSCVIQIEPLSPFSLPNNSAMFIHVETRCFPLRRNMQRPAQSNKPGGADDSCGRARCGAELEWQNEITGER